MSGFGIEVNDKMLNIYIILKTPIKHHTVPDKLAQLANFCYVNKVM